MYHEIDSIVRSHASRAELRRFSNYAKITLIGSNQRTKEEVVYE